MNELWKLMAGTLGGAWVNQYGAIGSPAYEVWCKGLADFHPLQIKNGYLRFLKSGDDFISLVKFRSCCEDLANKPPEHNRAAYLPYKKQTELPRGHVDEDELRFERLTGISLRHDFVLGTNTPIVGIARDVE